MCESSSAERSRLDALIVGSWPEPLAMRWQRVLNATETHEVRQRLAEAHVAFLQLMWVCLAAESVVTDGGASLFAGLRKGDSLVLDKPSDGAWAYAVQQLLKTARVVPLARKIADWWSNAEVDGEKVATLVQRQLEYRNRNAHDPSGDAVVHRDAAAATATNLRAIFTSATWMSDVRLLHVLSTHVDPPRTKGRLRWLTGAGGSIPRSVASSWEGALAMGGTYAIDVSEPTVALRLDPLLGIGWLQGSDHEAILLLHSLGREKRNPTYSSAVLETSGPARLERGVDGTLTKQRLRQLLEKGFSARRVQLSALSPLPTRERELSQVVDRFVIKERIGEGGAALVYRVYDQRLDEEVALKVLRDELVSDQRLVQRFLRETKKLRELRSEYVVEIYNDGDLDDDATDPRPFYTMALASHSLEDCIQGRRGTYTVADLAAWVRDAARGLKAIHAAGLVHRDIKPRNLLFVKGRLVVADLGTLHDTQAQTLAHTSHGREGTDGFIASEVLSGGQVTAQADIYALGRTLELGLKRAEGDARRLRRWTKLLSRDRPRERPALDDVIRHLSHEELDEKLSTYAILKHLAKDMAAYDTEFGKRVERYREEHLLGQRSLPMYDQALAGLRLFGSIDAADHMLRRAVETAISGGTYDARTRVMLRELARTVGAEGALERAESYVLESMVRLDGNPPRKDTTLEKLVGRSNMKGPQKKTPKPKVSPKSPSALDSSLAKYSRLGAMTASLVGAPLGLGLGVGALLAGTVAIMASDELSQNAGSSGEPHKAARVPLVRRRGKGLSATVLVSGLPRQVVDGGQSAYGGTHFELKWSITKQKTLWKQLEEAHRIALLHPTAAGEGWERTEIAFDVPAQKHALQRAWADLDGAVKKAARVLAEQLTDRVLLGHRPVTLVGVSLGVSVLLRALQQLGETSVAQAVESVALWGAPHPLRPEDLGVLSLVSGNVSNGFSENDLFLRHLNAQVVETTLPAGLSPVGQSAVRDIDVSDQVLWHTDYITRLGDLEALAQANGGHDTVDG